MILYQTRAESAMSLALKQKKDEIKKQMKICCHPIFYFSPPLRLFQFICNVFFAYKKRFNVHTWYRTMQIKTQVIPAPAKKFESKYMTLPNCLLFFRTSKMSWQARWHCKVRLKSIQSCLSLGKIRFAKILKFKWRKLSIHICTLLPKKPSNILSTCTILQFAKFSAHSPEMWTEMTS